MMTRQTAGLLIFACLIAVNLAKAQQAAGIHFEEGLSWQQVLAKAKADNKPIFLDCFATWCGPCKTMDRDVYSDPQVGAYFNEHYISVKVQMDTTKQDNDSVLSWKKDTESLKQEYKISAYPTFLFFSPDGKALHKAVGRKSAKDFMALAQDAVTPGNQYYTLLERYKTGKDYQVVPELARQTIEFDDVETANAMALDYIDNYLTSLKEEELTTKSNIQFLGTFLSAVRNDKNLASTSRIFQALYHMAAEPGKGDGPQIVAQHFVDRIIAQEEIDPQLWTGTGKERKCTVENPDWAALAESIMGKFGAEFAARVVLNSKISWYQFKEDYPNLITFYLDWADKYGVPTKGLAGKYGLNNNLWAAFEHCSDPHILIRAAAWQRKVVDDNQDSPEVMDTLANLLYKAGQVHEAIAWEERAAKLADAQAAENSGKYSRKITADKSFRKNLEKMKQGLPTWGTS